MDYLYNNRLNRLAGVVNWTFLWTHLRFQQHLRVQWIHKVSFGVTFWILFYVPKFKCKLQHHGFGVWINASFWKLRKEVYFLHWLNKKRFPQLENNLHIVLFQQEYTQTDGSPCPDIGVLPFRYKISCLYAVDRGGLGRRYQSYTASTAVTLWGVIFLPTKLSTWPKCSLSFGNSSKMF